MLFSNKAPFQFTVLFSNTHVHCTYECNLSSVFHLNHLEVKISSQYKYKLVHFGYCSIVALLKLSPCVIRQTNSSQSTCVTQAFYLKVSSIYLKPKIIVCILDLQFPSIMCKIKRSKYKLLTRCNFGICHFFVEAYHFQTAYGYNKKSQICIL